MERLEALRRACKKLNTAQRDIIIFGFSVVLVTGVTSAISIDFAPIAFVSAMVLGAVVLIMYPKIIGK